MLSPYLRALLVVVLVLALLRAELLVVLASDKRALTHLAFELVSFDRLDHWYLLI